MAAMSTPLTVRGTFVRVYKAFDRQIQPEEIWVNTTAIAEIDRHAGTLLMQNGTKYGFMPGTNPFDSCTTDPERPYAGTD